MQRTQTVDAGTSAQVNDAVNTDVELPPSQRDIFLPLTGPTSVDKSASSEPNTPEFTSHENNPSEPTSSITDFMGETPGQELARQSKDRSEKCDCSWRWVLAILVFVVTLVGLVLSQDNAGLSQKDSNDQVASTSWNEWLAYLNFCLALPEVSFCCTSFKSRHSV